MFNQFLEITAKHMQELNKFLEMANRSLVAGYIDAAELCGIFFLQVSALSHGSCPDPRPIQLYRFQIDSMWSDSPFQLSRSWIGPDLCSYNIESWKIVWWFPKSLLSRPDSVEESLKAKDIHVHKEEAIICRLCSLTRMHDFKSPRRWTAF